MHTGEGGRAVSKAGWMEKGLSGKRGPRERMRSPNALVHPSASVEQRCERLGGQTPRPHGAGRAVSSTRPGRIAVRAKGKFSRTDPVLI